VSDAAEQSEKAEPHEHMRCLCCGRLARMPDKGGLPAIFRPDHVPEVKIQEFTGNGKAGKGTGFAWSDRAPEQAELIALQDLVATVGTRLRQEIGVELPPSNKREAALVAENAALRKKIELQKKKLRAAKDALRIAIDKLRARKPT
jgi:hypothetical protein